MKNKKIIYIILALILLIIIATIIYFIYIKIIENNMDYKFENGKLYITTNLKDWSEVPYDFSLTIEHLQEVNNGRYRDETYQMDNKKIIFYLEKKIQRNEIYDADGNKIELFSPSPTNDEYAIYLVYSDDKGKNWNLSPIGTNYWMDTVVKINFKNTQEGKITQKGRDNISYYDFTTTDGGMNWEYNAN